MKFIETPIFTRKLKSLMNDEEYRKLQNHLLMYPKSGDVIIGSGGLRKIRWHDSRSGKRGGNRIIYFFFDKQDIILMLIIYSKREKDDLTKKQLTTLKSLVKREFK